MKYYKNVRSSSYKQNEKRGRGEGEKPIVTPVIRIKEMRIIVINDPRVREDPKSTETGGIGRENG